MYVVGAALRLMCALLVITIPAGAAERSSPAISLPQALRRALAANPRLTAAERDIGIAGGLRIQAGVLPNPEVQFELDNALGSGPYKGLRSAETNLQLSQLVELGGKREARIAAGEAGIGAAVWQRRATRLEVLSEAAIAFITIISSQRRIEIFDEQIASFDTLIPLLERRVQEGASSPAETLRAQVAADLFRVERERAKTQLATARRDLAILMGDGSPRFGKAVGKLTSIGGPATVPVDTSGDRSQSATDALDGGRGATQCRTFNRALEGYSGPAHFSGLAAFPGYQRQRRAPERIGAAAGVRSEYWQYHRRSGDARQNRCRTRD